MSPNLSQVDELAATVRSDPTDIDARRSLVDALIEQGDFEPANAHLDVLQSLAREHPWVVEIEERLAVACGDTLRVARARRRYRELTDALKDDDHDSDVHTEHPSETQPRLRLLAGGADPEIPEASTHFLQDIAGQARIKSLITDVLKDVLAARASAPGPWLGGTLFYGPPGCGKTYCASVIAGELGANFVPIDLAEQRSQKSMQSLLDLVTAESDVATVLFLHNLDVRSLNAKTGQGHAETLEPLCDILDDARTKLQLVILGSATLPWHVSNKIANKARCGRVILVLPPDAPARHLFLTQQLMRSGATLGSHDVEWLVNQTDGYSFNELAELIEVAMNGTVGRISRDSIHYAVQAIPPSSPEWLTAAGHHALVNERSGIYDDLLAYFRSRQPFG